MNGQIKEMLLNLADQAKHLALQIEIELELEKSIPPGRYEHYEKLTLELYQTIEQLESKIYLIKSE
jgi:hypothetical protein